MPLLKKTQFDKAEMPEALHDDEEVFYCAITNEIFRDYEAFSERMFLCNSMVWTCSLTGKANLTYSEALESEENARKNLKEFPEKLKIPILYIATRTKRSAFGDMADDIFNYAKDRFFIGENVETSFTGSNWKDSHVLQVLAPENPNKKTPTKNGNNNENHHASLYKYEIEHLDAYDEDISEIMIVDCNQIRRKKGSFSRERCKLFLKQYVEQNNQGIFVIKPSAIESFNIDKMSFQQIFDGPLPEFPTSKKVERALNGKKIRQESLHKFLTKGNAVIKNGANNSSLLEKMRKREEEFKLLKQQKEEEKLAMKQKKKEENLIIAGRLKDWYKPKEDLELIDHKKLPEPTPVKSKVPDEYFGDMLMVLEFVTTFSKQLSTKDFFPGGLTIELMERALTKNEVAGPFTDLIQMLLNALFNFQHEEASQYTTETENPSSIKEDTSDHMNLHEATRLATIASKWSKQYQGLPLGHLPLYSVTTSEILRLHLLSSGAIINNTGARWRYQQRGGYTSEDDPGLYLRVHRPHILKALEIKNVVELTISDKLEILSCLVHQLLTYAEIRDVVDEQLEKTKLAKIDYKLTLAAERRRKQEFLAAKLKLKKSEETDQSKLENELNKLEIESEKEKAKNELKLEEYKKASYDKQVLMGQDRAFRQYLKLESVPGFFVNFEEANPGKCLGEVVKQHPDLVNAGHAETVAHIRKIMQDTNSSDKENSPSSPKKVNGIHNSLQQQSDTFNELLLCSADETNCIVHSTNKEKIKWSFYHEEEKFNELIDSLNKRGVRENDLQENLTNNKEEIEKLIGKTLINYLNFDFPEKENEPRRSLKMNKARYEDANLGYSLDMNPEDVLHSAMIEHLLEMEEKIFAGNLGRLSIKDRDKWRSCLQNKNYKDLDKTIIKKENTEINNQNNHGNHLITLNGVDSNIDNHNNEAINSLSIALVQLAHAVEPKYLKKPLGRIKSRNDKKIEDRLNMWEQSLRTSTSFSQIFLHYSTLDSCIMWAKSVLLARCRICRRPNDSENMLLCDSCNCGHHLYCLKPKLKSVPPGDWYCSKCQDEKKVQNVEVVEPPPRKRPIFRDEEIDEENSEDNDIQSDASSGETDEDEDLDDVDLETVSVKIELCKTCGSGGELICCEKCSNNYHIECVEPPLRRAPRGSWLCTSCKRNNERKRNHDKNCSNGAVVQRRCAAKALYKIHDFAKSLRQLSESDDSGEEEVINKRPMRREEGRTDLPLHNSALHGVLSEIMKDNNAWPFLRPVQKTEVPDYYDVITKPMDFGTIKYKLNMGEYHEDAQFMSDALLVFQNCNTYNHTDDDVYKCGVQLLKHFQKKCRELGLKLPEEMDYNDHSVRPKKKMRTK